MFCYCVSAIDGKHTQQQPTSFQFKLPYQRRDRKQPSNAHFLCPSSSLPFQPWRWGDLFPYVCCAIGRVVIGSIRPGIWPLSWRHPYPQTHFWRKSYVPWIVSIHFFRATVYTHLKIKLILVTLKNFINSKSYILASSLSNCSYFAWV